MKIRIESDGTAYGSRILDENGNSIEGITRVEWDHATQMQPRALVQLACIKINAGGEARFEVIHPTTRQMIRIKGFIGEDGKTIIIGDPAP